jgi:hypothetical protein
MATTIKSTDLDFDAIRDSLKLYFAQRPEFQDYNFEASALSNVLDVLAYNTHYNALLANFALNESFLSTAQLRSSLVGLAGALGYTVGSRKAAFAVVNFYVQNAAAPSSMTMPAGFKFSTTIDNKTYTFQTRDTLTAYNDGANRYNFFVNNNVNIQIYEGIEKTKVFVAGPANENDTYVIPVKNIDLNTVIVRVYESPTTTSYDLYTNINALSTINESSRIFVIKEAPNGFYEITFGNGVRLGQYPLPGNKIEVDYTVVAGPEANGARSFTPQSTLSGLTVYVTTVTTSSAGSYKEDRESIRKNAPYVYAAQNRMVTAEDYAALTYRNYQNLIEDIKAWGGEDNIPPKYGTVYLSIVFNTDDAVVQQNTKAGVTNLAKNLSVASFNVEFVDPIETYLEVETEFQFNPNLTSSSQTAIENIVKSTMQNYFDANLGSFDQSFRRSNMLTLVDAVDDSVLSSKADVRMQNRFVPKFGITGYTINYPAPISIPLNVISVIKSGIFLMNGKTCFLRNKDESTIIEVVDTATGKLVYDNIGYYDPETGLLTLSFFNGTLITGSYIKITAVPQNPSVVNSVRNNILLFDASASTSRAILSYTV